MFTAHLHERCQKAQLSCDLHNLMQCAAGDACLPKAKANRETLDSTGPREALGKFSVPASEAADVNAHSSFCFLGQQLATQTSHPIPPSSKMFSLKKIVLVAACVALALGPTAVAAEQQSSHLRIHVHGYSLNVKEVSATSTSSSTSSTTDNSGDSEDSSSDSGVTEDDVGSEEDSDSASGSQDDVGSSIDADDSGSSDIVDIEVDIEDSGDFEEDAESSSSSSDVAEGSIDSEDFCSGEGESQISVEGAEGVFCVKNKACVADVADGACPGPQDGLPNGAVCGKVQSGVYGCKINIVKHHHKKHHHTKHRHKKPAVHHRHKTASKAHHKKTEADHQTKSGAHHKKTDTIGKKSHHGKQN